MIPLKPPDNRGLPSTHSRWGTWVSYTCAYGELEPGDLYDVVGFLASPTPAATSVAVYRKETAPHATDSLLRITPNKVEADLGAAMSQRPSNDYVVRRVVLTGDASCDL